MSKRGTYEVFIGLLALMISIMLILELMIGLPNDVLKSFYYIDLIVLIIFAIDYLGRFLLSENRINFIIVNIIDLLSIIPIQIYLIVFRIIDLTCLINIQLIIKIVMLIRLVILVLKFKSRIKEVIKINRFIYVLILTTLVIVISAVIISLLEGMSFGNALWWCFVTFTTVGYGDVLLTTTIGRIVAVILMVVGIGFIGITTSTIAVYIINDGKKKPKKNFKGEVIENVKNKLNNFDELSENDIEDIYKILKSLKK
ncbi:MAG: ion channel [Clostridium sp.]